MPEEMGLTSFVCKRVESGKETVILTVMLPTCVREVTFQTLEMIHDSLKFFLLSLRHFRDQVYWHYDGEIKIRSSAIVRISFKAPRPEFPTCVRKVAFQTLEIIQNTLKFFLFSLRPSRDQVYWYYDGKIRIRSSAIVRIFFKRPGKSFQLASGRWPFRPWK
jgi:hypothetical protein